MVPKGSERSQEHPHRGAKKDISMPKRSTVELKDLRIAADIGTYGPDDVVPDAHYLDLTLVIDPSLVLIDQDAMDRVFDYDPLIAQIDQLAQDGHYETQERLMTRIVKACAAFPQIEAVDIKVCKGPVLNGTGTLGVRLHVSKDEFKQMRIALGH